MTCVRNASHVASQLHVFVSLVELCGAAYDERGGCIKRESCTGSGSIEYTLP